ncbi:MAG: hypothetical protein ABSH52_04280 [Terriglobia bacterium]
MAEQIERMTRSNHAILEFEDLRFRLNTSESGQQKEIPEQVATILRDEINRTAASLKTARRDSRLGYEWETDYFYTPEGLEEKLRLLKLTLDVQIPVYRQLHGIPG